MGLLMNKPDGERLAKVETKMDDLTLVQGNILVKVEELKTILQDHNLKELTTHNLFDKQIGSLSERVHSLEKQGGSEKWLNRVFTAVFTALILILVQKTFNLL